LTRASPHLHKGLSQRGFPLKRPYYLLDVFTQTPLSGNPLAVVLESAGLDAERMQKITREFNLSETVFILDPRDPVNTAKLRIFTAVKELPFAGHPTVGTAALLAELRAPDHLKSRDVAVIFEETIGIVSCTVRRPSRGATVAHFDLPKLPESVGAPPPKAKIAAALGLAEADLGFRGHEPALYSAGLPTTLVPVKDLATIARARPHLPLFGEVFGETAAYLYTDETAEKENDLHARMFGPALGVFEDPATGASAAALAGALMVFEKPENGDHTVRIEQGFEMGRPSLIVLGMTVAGGLLQNASIGGPVVIVGQGTVDL
jgi:trans-2,3-dihydro-3-hydroxyanthranilate isomerase